MFNCSMFMLMLNAHRFQHVVCLFFFLPHTHSVSVLYLHLPLDSQRNESFLCIFVSNIAIVTPSPLSLSITATCHHIRNIDGEFISNLFRLKWICISICCGSCSTYFSCCVYSRIAVPAHIALPFSLFLCLSLSLSFSRLVSLSLMCPFMLWKENYYKTGKLTTKLFSFVIIMFNLWLASHCEHRVYWLYH